MNQGSLSLFKLSLITSSFMLLAACNSMQSSPSSSVLENSAIGFPAQISLISFAKGFGSFDENFSVEDNECIVIDKEKPENSEGLFNKLTDKLIKEGAVNRVGLDEQQVKEAFNLVKSGEFKNDLNYTRDSLIKNISMFRQGVRTKIKETVTHPQSSFDLIRNSPEYLQINPSNNALCEQGIKALLTNQDYGQLGSCAPGTVGRIVDKLKSDKMTSPVIETTHIFTNKNNRSSRLAIIAYAKMHGINLTEDDLDKLDQFLDTSKESDLSPLIKVGIDKMAEKYGGKDVQAFIKKKDKECSIN